MKKILLGAITLIVAMLFASCATSPDDKAKKLIKDHLHETLHDEKSYESVSYGVLDSVFTTVYDDDLFVVSSAKFLEYKDKFDSEMKDFDLYSDMYSQSYRNKALRAYNNATEYLDSITLYGTIADSIKRNFKPVFNGWSMNHSYRANNASGNKVIGHFRFYFDKDITKLIDTKDVGENANK